MAIRILSGENITGTITGIGTYTAGNSVKIFEAQRSGGAVKSDWSYHDSNTTMSFGTSTLHPLSIKTNDTERIRVQNTGNIGINNNNPTEILDISDDDGNTNIRVSDSSANSEVGLKLKNDAKTWTLQNWGSGGDNLRLLNNAGNIVQLWDDNGNVMIGNANDPEKKLHIYTSTTDDTPQVLIQNGSSGDASLTFNVSGQSYVIGIDHDDSSKFKIAASGNLGTNDRVTLLSSGNVGIGTISPQNKFVVANGTNNNQNIEIAPNYIQSFNRQSGNLGYASLDFYASSYTFNVADVLIGTNGKFLQGKRNTGSAVIDMIGFGAGTDRLQIKGGTSGAAESIAFFDTAGQMATFYNSNLGIGLTNASAKLQVVSGDEQLTNFSGNVTDRLAYSRISSYASTSGTTTGAAALELVGTANGSSHGRHAWIGAEGTSNTNFLTKLKFKVRGETNNGYAWAGSSEAPTIMTLQGNGNVGIGTTNPGRKLTVTGDASGDSNNLLIANENDTNGDSASIGFSMLSNNTYVKSGIFFERTTTQGRGSLHLAVNNEVNGNNVSKSDAKLTINNSGNVGIGTASPNAGVRLEVNGIISANGDNSPTGGGLGFGDYQTGGYKWIQSFESQELRINPLGNNVVFPASNVGIGTSSPAAGSQLTLRSSASTGMTILSASNTGECFINFSDNDDANVGQIFYGHSPDRMSFRVGDNTRMTILGSDGNVGIGTTSPSEKLSVANGSVAINNSHSFMVGGATGDTVVGRLKNTAGVLNLEGASSRSVKIGSGSNGEVVRIDNTNQRVGVGTTSPSEKLHVHNGAIAAGPSSTNGGAVLKQNYASPHHLGVISSHYSSGNFIMGYGAQGKAGSSGYTSTYGNFSGGHSALEIGGTSFSFKMDSSNSQTTVGSDVSLNTLMKINRTGVGIGTDDGPGDINAKLHIYKQAGDNTVNELLRLDCGENNHNVGKGGAIVFRDINVYTDTAKIIAQRIGNTGGSTLQFALRGSEAMRIQSAGQVCIGTNSTTVSSSVVSAVFGSGSEATLKLGGHSGTHTMIQFFHTGTVVGSIISTTTATAYNTSSDYRLKEDLKDFAGLDMVSKIPVYDFKWKTDESRSYGVMAHELEEVLPQAVIGEKDAEEMQSVDYSKIVPLLVKSIQELKAEVENLKSQKQ